MADDDGQVIGDQAPATGAAEMHSRDLNTLDQDGPGLTQFETPRARQFPGGEVPPGGGQAEAERTRPRYSPVAQPGMVSEIHWHTVKSEQHVANGQPDPRRGREHATRGMIGRLNRRHPDERGGGGRRRGGRGKRGGGHGRGKRK